MCNISAEVRKKLCFFYLSPCFGASAKLWKNYEQILIIFSKNEIWHRKQPSKLKATLIIV